MLSILDNLGGLTFRTVMGIEEVAVTTKKSHPVGPDGKKLKPCCACPDTKRLRDACIIEKGEENCGDLIEAHKAFVRRYKVFILNGNPLMGVLPQKSPAQPK